MKRAILLALAVGCSANLTHAVIVGPGNGTANTTGAGMSSGWNYVGAVASASGVYLGNGWVLTAAHVGGVTAGSTTFTLGSTIYTADTGATRLTNPDTTVADLQMFHLATSPALALLPLSSTTPSLATEVYIVGYGRDPRNTSPTYYGNTTTWPVDSNFHTANAGGFGYAAGNLKRWGTNLIDGTTSTDIGYGMTSLLTANFYGTTSNAALNNYLNSTPGTTSEALLSPGDSGGGVFDSAGVLVGMNSYVGQFPAQPADTAIFGNVNDMANISVYRTQILALVPEPSAVLVLGGMLAPALLGRRRRTARRD